MLQLDPENARTTLEVIQQQEKTKDKPSESSGLHFNSQIQSEIWFLFRQVVYPVESICRTILVEHCIQTLTR